MRKMNPHRHRRTGFTLIELSAVITVSTAMLAVASVLIINIQSLMTKDQNAVESMTSRVDLARQFRRDVNQALTAELSDDSRQLVLTSPQTEITYRFSDHVLSRRVGEGIDQRSNVKPFTVQWTVSDRLVRLDGVSELSDSQPPWTVDAALSFDASPNTTAPTANEATADNPEKPSEETTE